MAQGNKISPELRARLIGQKKAMGSGLIINNKNFVKGIFHILPAKAGETPGMEYLSFFCRGLGIGTTSPKTFGLRCPIMDYKDKLSVSGTKEERDAAYKAVNIKTDYWTAVVPQDDLGTVQAPNLRIFRAPKRVYEAIISRMVDDDIGEDVTDLLNGRPCMIKKSGSDKDTKWTLDFLDRQPISDDPEYIDAIQALVDSLTITQKFFRVDWDKLEKIYTALTGEDMDPSYREQEGADAGTAGNDDDHTSPEVAPSATSVSRPAARPTAKPTTPAARTPAATKPAAAPVRRTPPPPPEPPPAPEPDENGILLGETQVQFKDETGEDVYGTVMKLEDDGKYEVLIPEGEPGAGVWTVAVDEFVILESAQEPEELQPEPEPVAPKGPQRRSAAPVVTPPADDAPVDEGEQEAPAEVPKPAPRAAAKPAAKAPAPVRAAAPAAKPAAKPAATAVKPTPATTSLRNRVMRK